MRSPKFPPASWFGVLLLHPQLLREADKAGKPSGDLESPSGFFLRRDNCERLSKTEGNPL